MKAAATRVSPGGLGLLAQTKPCRKSISCWCSLSTQAVSISLSDGISVLPDEFPSIAAHDALARDDILHGPIPEWEPIDTRLPATAGGAFPHMGRDLVEASEPNPALANHVLDQAHHGVASRGATRDEGVPNRYPKTAMAPGGIELGAKHLGRAFRRGDRQQVAEI